MVTKSTESFKANYDKLAKIAEELSGNQEIDIDALVPKVDDGLAAYKVCSERIAQVQKMLAERLQDDGGEKGSN